MPQRTKASPAAHPEHHPTWLARVLGWFSVALGAFQLLAPDRVHALVGVRDHESTRALMRAVGLRELITGAGIFRGRHTRRWLRARVAGDLFDLALLGTALRSDRNDREQLSRSAAAVAGVALLDVLAAATASRSSAADERGADEPARVGAAVTINRPPAEVAPAWHRFEHVPAVSDFVSVRFTPAYGGQGTEVRVEVEGDVPGGVVGAGVAKMFGNAPGQQLRDDLRRFKQVLEMGEVLRSEGSPEGPRTRRQFRQRKAQARATKEGSRR